MVNSDDHPLKQWLRGERLSNGIAAKALGVSSVTVSRWFMGIREMKVESRIAVERMTEGQVTRSDIEDWQAEHLKRLKLDDGNHAAAGTA